MAEKQKPEERLHPILSNEEVLEARAKARASIEAEQKKRALKTVQDEEVQRLKREEGLVSGDKVKDEMVSITIDVAPYTDRIIMNFRDTYLHGRTYTVPRHVADAIRDIMWQTKKHEHDTKDENLYTFYGKQRSTTLSPAGIKNAPQAAA